MIIESSKVGMSSSRSYFHYENKETVSLEVLGGKDAVELYISDASKTKLEQLKEASVKIKEEEKEAEKQRKEDEAKNAIATLQQLPVQDKGQAPLAAPIEDAKITMLKRILALLNGKEYKDVKDMGKTIRTVNGSVQPISEIKSLGKPVKLAEGVNLNLRSGTTWTRAIAQSSFVSESEVTTFSSTGVAKTADGRQISFNIDVEMSRSFESYMESVTMESIFKDPLTINVDSNVASISDMKFRFDIDADGKEEYISMANNNSRFLALDKNGDGIVNDGSELFGARTGDGFKELAEYDEDKNGWIDEADSIFNKLFLWTKDEDGNDIKTYLKDADVGAIYLGNVNTDFSIKNAINQTNGQICSTGIYLKESGGVGTVQHVDLAL
ncbi:MAG: hypothetical protein HUJ71_02030 [Pseudobutyrivibrio sp.]|nr:hypothetical protein [Pseudobutyrivibrio sp.]